MVRAMKHMVNKHPGSKLHEGGLRRLHSADDIASNLPERNDLQENQRHMAQSYLIRSETDEHRSFTCGRKQPLDNTGVRLWTRLCPRGVCHEVREGNAMKVLAKEK